MRAPHPLGVLAQGQPAVGGRVAQQGDDTIAVRVRGSHLPRRRTVGHISKRTARTAAGPAPAAPLTSGQDQVLPPSVVISWMTLWAESM
jgi:hypothetical protein